MYIFKFIKVNKCTNYIRFKYNKHAYIKSNVDNLYSTTCNYYTNDEINILKMIINNLILYLIIDLFI